MVSASVLRPQDASRTYLEDHHPRVAEDIKPEQEDRPWILDEDPQDNGRDAHQEYQLREERVQG